jgi:exonuclease VII large subunit
MWQVINNSYLPLVDLSKRIYGDNIKVISNLESIFKLVSPEAQLDRGFAIIRTKDGQLLKRAENFNKFDELEIQMCDGNIKAKVIGD